MWVEELRIKNVKCFDDTTIRFARGIHRYPWITLLGENGSGKSTALQALALLLAGPESVPVLLPRPVGWIRDEKQLGLIATNIHRDKIDPRPANRAKNGSVYQYSYDITAGKGVGIEGRSYAEPAVVERVGDDLTYLRKAAFTAWPKGWFAAGYGAFRRTARMRSSSYSPEEPDRYRNFSTLFDDNAIVESFDKWMFFLDYRISKNRDEQAKRQFDTGVDAINQLLPNGVRFDRVTEDGRVQFDINGLKVPMILLSDGYRSVLSLSGDLVFRLTTAFPASSKPLKERGVVLIDELDIHLHPTWQRNIATMLRAQFPNLQFIVATHSPFIAAGAGEDALTLNFAAQDGIATVNEVLGVSARSIDDILEGPAFGLTSIYSPDTQAALDRFDILLQKHARRTPDEEKEYQSLVKYVAKARPYGGPPEPGSLQDRVEKYLEKVLP